MAILNEKASTMVEYCLLAACISLVAIASISFMGGQAKSTIKGTAKTIAAGSKAANLPEEDE